jgi:hypothetical protein
VADLDLQVRRDAAWAQGGTAEISVIDADGRDVFAAELDVPVRGPAVDLWVPEDGSHLPPGTYSAFVQLHPSGAGDRIRETIRVTIEPASSPTGDVVLWRRGQATGPQPVRTADPRFRRNERLRLELPAPGHDPVTARLLDRTGAPLSVPVTVTERLDDTDAFRWVVVDLALTPLAAGDYAIEVTPPSTVTAFRIVP